MPRCLPPETAARELETAGCVVRVVPELPAALKTAREELKEDELLLICGSVYLAGTVRAIATECDILNIVELPYTEREFRIRLFCCLRKE